MKTFFEKKVTHGKNFPAWRSFLFSGILLLIAHSTFAQFTMLATDWDSVYINKFPAKWSARLYLVSKNQRFNLTNSAEAKADFFPNNKLDIGAGLSFRNFALDLGVNVSKKATDTLRTKSIDLLSSIYTNQHVFDVNFQFYSGFYSASDSDGKSPQFFRSDIRTFNFALNYLYNFSYRKFSFNAAFIGTQIQRKSAGSPLAGVFMTYYDLRSNTDIIPTDMQPAFNQQAQFSEANLLTSGLIGGYAYSFVLPAHFFITLSVTPGVSFNVGDVKSGTYYHVGNPITFSPKIISRNAIGYAGNKIYSLVSFMIDRNFVNLGNSNQLNYNVTKVKWVVGYRIK